MAQAAADLHLSAGARVAIIGGGPAGSFFALHLHRFARLLSLPLSVTIFERKDFARRGQAGCNKCAGILSSRLLRGLEELGLHLPEHLIMGHLESYILHLANETVEIAQPDPGRKIISVYRGAGPLHAALPPEVSFDAWLLAEARVAGTEVISANVRRIIAGPLMEVETEQRRLPFDLVVLATGVNARPPDMSGLPYTPPHTEIMAQDELRLETPLTATEKKQVQVYVGQQSGLLFGALIPKGELLNVSLLGHGLTHDAVGKFLQNLEQGGLAEAVGQRLCGCNPRIAVSPARCPFSDRFVAVGDAAVTRLYKDGIGSAFLTAQRAAWTALHVGISRQAFARGYEPFCRSIALDNRVGRFLFWLWQQSQARPHLARSWLRILLAEKALPMPKRHGHRALWGLLTGDDSYITIARNLLHRGGVGALAAIFLPGGWLPQRQGYEAARKGSFEESL